MIASVQQNFLVFQVLSKRVGIIICATGAKGCSSWTLLLAPAIAAVAGASGSVAGVAGANSNALAPTLHQAKQY